jgi:uncharacterized protein (UPF0332 family)
MKEKWLAMCQSSTRTAKLLHERHFFRSSMSRTYYAAYAALVAVLSAQRGIRFDYGGNNPSHERLRRMIWGLNAKRFERHLIAKVHHTMNRLWTARIEADYGVKARIDENYSRECLINLHRILGYSGLEL